MPAATGTLRRGPRAVRPLRTDGRPAIAKVAEAYKRDKSIQPRFRAHGALPYDQRIMGWRGVECVSLLTLSGREIIPVRFGQYQAARMDRVRG